MKRLSHLTGWGVGLSTVAVLAGCGVTGGAHAPAVTAAPSSTTPTRAATTSTTAAAAVPARLPASLYGNLRTVHQGFVFTLDSDGDLLIIRSTKSTDKSQLLGRQELSVSPTGGGAEVSVPTQDRSGHFQINGAAISRRWVVWQETKSSALENESWTMYAFNRATRKVTRLTASTKLADGNDPPWIPGDTYPVVLGDRVYWIALSGTFQKKHANLYGCELTSCAPKLYAKDAAFVTTDGRRVFALTYADYNSTPVSTMHVLEVDADQRVSEAAAVKLGHRLQPMGLAVNSTQYMLLARGKRTEMLTASRKSANVTKTVVGRQGEDFGYPVATDSYLAWAECSGSSSLELAGYALIGGKQYMVGNRSGLYNIEGAGRYLVWSDAANTHTVKSKRVDRVVRIK